MFFKNKKGQLQIVIVIFSVLTIALASCKWQPVSNLSIGEANPISNSIRVNFSGFSCLSKIDQSMNAYFDSQLSDQQILDAGQCIQAALRKFEFFTRDSKKSEYSPEAITDFLNREYLMNNKLSLEFVLEIMNLKVAILGGESSSLTRSELAKFIDLISLVTKEAIKNSPYIKIYIYANRANRDAKTDVDFVDLTNSKLNQARSQLRDTGRVFAELLSENKRAYDIKSLKNLLTQARVFFNWDKYHRNSISVEALVSLIMSSKYLVGASSKDNIEADAWPKLFDFYTTGFGLYLNYNLNIKNHAFMYGPTLDYFIEDMNSVFDLLERIIASKISSKEDESNFIALSSIENFLKNLEDTHILPNQIKVENIKPIYERMIISGLRNFKISENKSRPMYYGFGLTELRSLREEFNLWSGIQNYLSQASRDALNLNFENSLSEEGSTTDIVSTFDFSKMIQSSERKNDRVYNELIFLKTSFRPLFKANDGRTFVLPKNDYAKHGLKYDFFNLSKLNLIRAGVRMFIRSFAEVERASRLAGVTEAELKVFYNTIRSFGVSMRFVDPRKPNYGPNYLLEGSLFTFSGDGVPPPQMNDVKDAVNNMNLLNFHEISELISLMLSGGAVSQAVYDRVLLACRQEGVGDGPLDIFGRVKINRACFLRHFADNNFREISNLPNMMTSIQKLKLDSNFKRYNVAIENLQKISMIKCESILFIEQAEIATMVTVLHYIEVLFSIFDRDKNDYFDSYEVMNAYYRFNEFLNNTISNAKNTHYEVSMLKAIYFYLVKNKKLPSSRNYLQLKFHEFSYFDNNPFQNYEEQNMPNLTADRFDILQIIRVLFKSSSVTNATRECRN